MRRIRPVGTDLACSPLSRLSACRASSSSTVVRRSEKSPPLGSFGRSLKRELVFGSYVSIAVCTGVSCVRVI